MSDRDDLDRRYAVRDDPVVLTGMQALTRIVLDQVRADRAAGKHTAGFISGYPGSPIAGYDLELHRQRSLLAEHDIVHTMGRTRNWASRRLLEARWRTPAPAR